MSVATEPKKYEEKRKVTYHMNIMNEHFRLVDLSNAEVVINNPTHGIIEIHFNSDPIEVRGRRICSFCGSNQPADSPSCESCGGPNS